MLCLVQFTFCGVILKFHLGIENIPNVGLVKIFVFLANVEDYHAVSEERVNGVDSSDWIYPSARLMRSICPIASVSIFRFNLIGSGWLEIGFVQYPFHRGQQSWRPLIFAYFTLMIESLFLNASCWISVQ